MLWKCIHSLWIITLVLELNAALKGIEDEPLHLYDKNRDPYHIYDYKDHPCKRRCEKDAPAQECHYYLLLEHFTTMSDACYGCPDNQTECFLSQCVPADGVQRGILTANRMIPGPTIDVCEGDTVEVLVDNRMVMGEGTSLHWHGLRQIGSPYNDGTSLVTQCPLHTWAQMIYRYEAKDPGTHFWHSHSTIQRSEGLFGGLVVRTPHVLDPQGHLYDYDLPEHYIILSDWSHKPTGDAYPQDFHSGEKIKVDSLLVNGLGQSEGGPQMPHPAFQVKSGKRFRFRIAYSGIFDCPVYIRIDDHPLLVIATDGRSVEPLEVDALMILSGERYDFVLEAKQGVKANFWMRFKGEGRCAKQRVFQSAILRYEGAGNAEPEGEATYTNTDEKEDHRVLNGLSGLSTDTTFQVVDLQALESESEPDTLTQTPDKQFYISIGSSPVIDKRFFPPPNPFVSTTVPPFIRPVNHQLNYISSRLPPSPPLSQFEDIPKEMLCNNNTVIEDCSTVLCICVHMLNFDLGDLVEIVLVSYESGPIHPMHMHGHSFRVVSQFSVDRDITVEEVKAMDKRGEIPRVTSRAPFKDAIGAHDRAVTILRFRADNPGFWFFHCHIEFHAELGMGLILQAGKPDEMPTPPRGFPRCGSYKSNDGDCSAPKTKETARNSNLSAGEEIAQGYSTVIGLSIALVLLVAMIGFAAACIVIRKQRRKSLYSERVHILDSRTYPNTKL